MPKPMALRSISRLTVTLELWTAEITTGPSDSGFTDDMATQANELIRRAFHSCLDSWQRHLRILITPKSDSENGTREVGETALASRADVIKSVNSLGASPAKQRE